MFDHLLESSRWDDSNMWSNIGFGEEIGILENKKNYPYLEPWKMPEYTLYLCNHNDLRMKEIGAKSEIKLQAILCHLDQNYIQLQYCLAIGKLNTCIFLLLQCRYYIKCCFFNNYHIWNITFTSCIWNKFMFANADFQTYLSFIPMVHWNVGKVQELLILLTLNLTYIYNLFTTK